MFIRIALATAAVAAALVAVKDGGILADAGLTGSCTTITMPRGSTGAWVACTPGLLEGRPDLSRQQCAAMGVRGERQIWRCPVELVSAQG